MLRITAIDSRINTRKMLFTWRLGAQAGITRAKVEAKVFGQAEFLSDFRAEEDSPRLADFYSAKEWAA